MEVAREFGGAARSAGAPTEPGNPHRLTNATLAQVVVIAAAFSSLGVVVLAFIFPLALLLSTRLVLIFIVCLAALLLAVTVTFGPLLYLASRLLRNELRLGVHVAASAVAGLLASVPFAVIGPWHNGYAGYTLWLLGCGTVSGGTARLVVGMRATGEEALPGARRPAVGRARTRASALRSLTVAVGLSILVSSAALCLAAWVVSAWAEVGIPEIAYAPPGWPDGQEFDAWGIPLTRSGALLWLVTSPQVFALSIVGSLLGAAIRRVLPERTPVPLRIGAVATGIALSSVWLLALQAEARAQLHYLSFVDGWATWFMVAFFTTAVVALLMDRFETATATRPRAQPVAVG